MAVSVASLLGSVAPWTGSTAAAGADRPKVDQDEAQKLSEGDGTAEIIVNMRTHGHGQGWTDLNFPIPETVEELSYSKEVYHAEVGDFASAGFARFKLSNGLSRDVAEVGAGQFGHLRAVLFKSAAVGPGSLLFAGELQRFDGPWTDIEEKVRKTNALLRFSAPLGGGRN